jgi:hypothetical protein
MNHSSFVLLYEEGAPPSALKPINTELAGAGREPRSFSQLEGFLPALMP